MKYEAIIGLEIHIQMKTKSKMFCGCDNKDTEEPNINVCEICMGHPGTLPVVNQQAIDWGLKMALALNCTINQEMKFDRKHYYYPDLPKGYQISQFDQPLAEKGHLDIVIDHMQKRKIGITRLHLEEDAAKNTHAKDGTLVDFNRAGTPLMEIVSEPEIRSALEAKIYLQELHKIARYLNVSDADMEKGHFRCDANISLRPNDDTALYPKTEIKNLNSFKAVEKAIAFEIERQQKLWNKHKAPETLETRGWDDKKGETISQRDKEDSADYRYFPEPDLPPVIITEEQVKTVQRRLPEMPLARKLRFREEYELSHHDAEMLVADPTIGEYYENTISELKAWLFSLDETEGTDAEIWKKNRKKMSRLVNSWLTTEIFKLMNAAGDKFADLKITPENLAEFVTMLYQNKINSSAAQVILEEMYKKGADPSQVMDEKNLEQEQDEGKIEDYCDQAINKFPKIVDDYKAGKEKAIMFLVGQVMKESKGKANPQLVTDILRDKLK